jgi:hypothetical protein
LLERRSSKIAGCGGMSSCTTPVCSLPTIERIC